MFGMLQATLNQFKAESRASSTDPVAERRRKVHAKVEARAQEERETARQERSELFKKRREQQLDLALMHQKMRMLHGVGSLFSNSRCCIKTISIILCIIFLSCSLNLGKKRL